jgi:hypothetical protein
MADPNFWSIKGLESKLDSSMSKVKMIKNHISQLQDIKERIEKDFTGQSNEIMNVINDSKMLNRRIKEFHDYNLQKIGAAEADFTKGSARSSELFRKFRESYELLTKINDFLTKIELDVSLMKIELKELITRGELLKVHGDPIIVGKHVNDILRRFERVVQQKKAFEEEVKKINMLQTLLMQKI